MELAVRTYRVTAAFPSGQRFGLTAQMQRAAVSVGSNIVEGCGRPSNAALLSFLHIALGSATELEFQIGLATRLEFGNPADLAALRAQSDRVKGMLVRLIVALRPRPPKPAG